MKYIFFLFFLLNAGSAFAEAKDAGGTKPVGRPGATPLPLTLPAQTIPVAPVGADGKPKQPQVASSGSEDIKADGPGKTALIIALGVVGAGTAGYIVNKQRK